VRPALAAIALLLATPAGAIFGTQLSYEVRDAEDRPAKGAFVVARELGELGKFHGTVTYCIRAAAKGSSPTGLTKLDLPAATIEALALRDHRLEVLAYRPGHCVARVKGAESAILRLRPAPNRAEERLPYLEEVAVSLVCRRGGWGAGSPAALEKMIAAIEAEVKPLLHGPWERRIADRIHTYLKVAKTFPSLEDLAADEPLTEPKTPPPRDFIIVPGTWASKYDERKSLWIAAPPRPREQVISLSPPSGNRPGNAVGVVGAIGPIPGAVGRGGGGSAAARAPPAIRCRVAEPSKCNLDQRDETGETALGAAVKYFRVEEVKMLLEAGADPSVAVTPGGPRPAELVQQRMKNYSPGSWDVQQGQQILALLAASPKARRARDGVAAPGEVASCEPLNVLSPLRLR
jgi:hypothetical protein